MREKPNKDAFGIPHKISKIDPKPIGPEKEDLERFLEDMRKFRESLNVTITDEEIEEAIRCGRP